MFKALRESLVNEELPAVLGAENGKCIKPMSPPSNSDRDEPISRRHEANPTSTVEAHTISSSSIKSLSFEDLSTAAVQATSTSKSISLIEFDGLIMPKSEVPTNVVLGDRHHWRPRNPFLQTKRAPPSA
jgi:hypothetical protein